MSVYSVQITNKPLGVAFIDSDEECILSEILPNAQGHKHGLSVGDRLVAINGAPVRSVDAYYTHRLPFVATFKRAATETRSSVVLPIDVSKYITGNQNDGILFDRLQFHQSQCSLSVLSSNALIAGQWQWSVQITKCDIYRHEIGVVSKQNVNTLCNIKGEPRRQNSECDEMTAVAVYGCSLIENMAYYASMNEDGTRRCYKDLQHGNKHSVCWKEGDIITVCLDLDRWNVKFYLNHKKVRKAISIQPYKRYFPVLSFEGNCRYKLL